MSDATRSPTTAAGRAEEHREEPEQHDEKGAVPIATRSGPRQAGDPAWAWPAMFVGRVHPGLSEETRRDIRLFDAFPVERFGLPAGSAGWIGAGIALLLPLVFTFFRVGVTDVFTESLVFLALAMVLGYASPALGVLAVLFHGVFDLIHVLPTVRAAYDLPVTGPWWPLAGRLISFWLLWLLVVEVPLLTRSIRDHGFDVERRVPTGLRRPGTALAAGIVGGALVFVWTQGVPLLIRPVFVWSSYGSPTLEAIEPIQRSGAILVIAGGLLAAAAVVLRLALLGRRSDVEGSDVEGPVDVPATGQASTGQASKGQADNRRLAIVGKLVSYGLIILGVGGLVTGLFDVVLLAATLLATPYVAAFIASRVPYRRPLARIPVVVRFLVGFAITYVIGLVVTGITFDSALGSEFFPIVLIIAAGLIVFEILLGDVEEAGEGLPSSASGSGSPGADLPADLPPVVAVAIVIAVGALGLLGLPGPVFADNCSGIDDCYGAVGAGAAAAAAAAGVAGVITITRLAGGLRGRGRGGGRRGTASSGGGVGSSEGGPVSGEVSGEVSGDVGSIRAGEAAPTAAATDLRAGAGSGAIGGMVAASTAPGPAVGAAPGAADGSAVGSAPGTGSSQAEVASGVPASPLAVESAAPPTDASGGVPMGGMDTPVTDLADSSTGGAGRGATPDVASGGPSGSLVGSFQQADLGDFTASGGAAAGAVVGAPGSKTGPGIADGPATTTPAAATPRDESTEDEPTPVEPAPAARPAEADAAAIDEGAADPGSGARQTGAEPAAGVGLADVGGTVGGVGPFLQADLADFTASGGAEKGRAGDSPSEEDVDAGDTPREP